MFLRPLPHAAAGLYRHQTRYQMAGTHRVKQEGADLTSAFPNCAHSALDVPRAWLVHCSADRERVYLVIN